LTIGVLVKIFRPVAIGPGAGRARPWHRSRGLGGPPSLDQAHAAIAAMESRSWKQKRGTPRQRPRRLQARVVVGYRDLFPVDLSFAIRLKPCGYPAIYLCGRG